MKDGRRSRLARERAFHNDAFASDLRGPAAKYYSIQRAGRRLYEDTIRAAQPAEALEYGCGPGGVVWDLARRGARVTGIDISDEAIRQAQESSVVAGLDEAATFTRMDAHSLDFAADRFDVVAGSAILHHLDLNVALKEVSRVLRPDGTACFIEPVGHNPLHNGYRRLTRKMRTPDERPLRLDDLDECRQWFSEVDLTFFHLTTLAAVPLRATVLFEGVLGGLERLDRLLFHRLPALRRYAWMVVVRLQGPLA